MSWCKGSTGISYLPDTDRCHWFYWFCDRRNPGQLSSTATSICAEGLPACDHYDRNLMGRYLAGNSSWHSHIISICIIAADINPECISIKHAKDNCSAPAKFL